MLTHTYKARQLVTSQQVAEWKKQPALFFGEATHGLRGVVGGRHGVIPLASQNFSMLLFMCVMMPTCQCWRSLRTTTTTKQSTAGWKLDRGWSLPPCDTCLWSQSCRKDQQHPIHLSFGAEAFSSSAPFFSNTFRMHSNLRFIILCHSSPGAVAQGTTVNGSITFRMEVQWKLYWNVMKCAVKFRKKFGKFRIPEKKLHGGFWGSCRSRQLLNHRRWHCRSMSGTQQNRPTTKTKRHQAFDKNCSLKSIHRICFFAICIPKSWAARPYDLGRRRCAKSARPPWVINWARVSEESYGRGMSRHFASELIKVLKGMIDMTA